MDGKAKAISGGTPHKLAIQISLHRFSIAPDDLRFDMSKGVTRWSPQSSTPWIDRFNVILV
jgi:hypothetical protein